MSCAFGFLKSEVVVVPFLRQPMIAPRCMLIVRSLPRIMSPIFFESTWSMPRLLSVAFVLASVRSATMDPSAAVRVMIPRLSVVMSLSPPKRFAATSPSPQ